MTVVKSDLLSVAQDVTQIAVQRPRFSVCTLVNNQALYETLLASFLAGGFTPDTTEFLFADNRNHNRFEAYGGLRTLISAATGDYLILCHQDVRLLDDDASVLLERLDALDRLHPNWALAGNSGYNHEGQKVIRITDRFGENQCQGPFPQAVSALDENFIVLKRTACLAPSFDLKGFHLYGADLCIQALMRGLTCHVIDFHLHHESGVLRMDRSYYDCLEALEAKYHKLLQTRRIYTTCLDPILSADGLRLTWAKFSRLRKKWRNFQRYERPAK